MSAMEFADGGAPRVGAPVRASGDGEETHWRCGLVEGTTAGAASRLVDAEYRAELRLAGGRLMRGPGYAAAPRLTRQRLARVGAMLKLRQHARYHLHAAGVVAPDGAAWLLMGETGSGKSTLAYALARGGWRVLGEDGVVLEHTASGMIAHGWRDPLRVSIELAEWFPELRRHDHLVDWQDARHRVDVGATFVKRAAIAGLIAVERSSHDSMSPLSSTGALTMLVRQATFLMLTDHHAAAHLETLRELVDAVPCFTLRHTPAQLACVHSTIMAAAR